SSSPCRIPVIAAVRYSTRSTSLIGSAGLAASRSRPYREIAVDSAIPRSVPLPRHPVAVAEPPHAPDPLRRTRLPTAARASRHGQQGVELSLVEEADVLVLVSDLGLLNRLARVCDDPALAQREVKDAVQEAQVVARALDRLVAIEADRHELLNVLLRDVPDRLLAEEGHHMHAEVALVADGGRRLPALGDQM